MNEGEMKGVARQALNMMKRDVELKRFRFFLGVYFDGQGLKRLTRVERLIDEKLGLEWLDVEAKKNEAFLMMSDAVAFVAAAALPPDAVVFGSAANIFSSTEKFEALPKERREERRDETLKSAAARRRAAEEGYFTYQDVLTCYVHTPTQICHCWQDRWKPDAEIEMHVGDQNAATGRQFFMRERAK